MSIIFYTPLPSPGTKQDDSFIIHIVRLTLGDLGGVILPTLFIIIVAHPDIVH
jgi:hypothetical protein